MLACVFHGVVSEHLFHVVFYMMWRVLELFYAVYVRIYGMCCDSALSVNDKSMNVQWHDMQCETHAITHTCCCECSIDKLDVTSQCVNLKQIHCVAQRFMLWYLRRVHVGCTQAHPDLTPHADYKIDCGPRCHLATLAQFSYHFMYDDVAVRGDTIAREPVLRPTRWRHIKTTNNTKYLTIALHKSIHTT
jgi:hypothetical protein